MKIHYSVLRRRMGGWSPQDTFVIPEVNRVTARFNTIEISCNDTYNPTED